MIIQLSADSPADGDLIGGKGMGLIRLLVAGLPVPDAWCIPADVSTDPAARSTCLEDDLTIWWKEVSDLHPGGRWAVRSSAVAEDLADASFAGVYETILGVDSFESLVDAVRACWSSLDNQRAETYRGGLDMEESGSIALILQRMLEPEAAGVLLTTNPLKPFAGEISIDSTWGLGESLVSGRTDPDHFDLDRESGEVKTRRLGAKQLETVWSGEAIVERDVDDARRGEFSLTDQQIGLLHALAADVTDRIGPRRDLEWAIEGGVLRVLQDRPITNLPSENPDDVWSRRFGDEYLAECALPLPSDLMLRWIIDTSLKDMAVLQGRTDMAEMEPIRLYNGYAYFSGNYYAAGLRILPKGKRVAGPSEWFPPIVHERAAVPGWKPRLLVSTLTAGRRDKEHSGVKNNLVALDRHTAIIDRTVVPLITQDYTALSEAEWRKQFDHIEHLGNEHFRVLRWGMSVYNTFLHASLVNKLKAWADDESGDLYQDVISGLDDTRTAGINREIDELTTIAAADTDLGDLIRSGASYDEVRSATTDSGFWSAYDGFLATHGHRSDSRDVGRPRWREEPHLIIEFVRAQLRARDGVGTGFVSGAAKERRLEAQAEALSRAGSGPLGPVRSRALGKLMSTVQDYTRYRENQRYHLDYLLTHLRGLILEQGRRLTERGVIDRIDDVFYLTGDEFFAMIGGGAAGDGLGASIARREAEYARNSSRLPATYLFDDVETEIDEEEADVETPEGALRGAGVCRGQSTGRARVVASLSDLGTVESGDVLVAPNIDPGWTSVFPLLSGLIIETGGTLSHGAILAREYGIPAVSGVTGAIARIEDGARLRVDGNTGLVTFLD